MKWENELTSLADRYSVGKYDDMIALAEEIGV